MTRPEPATAPRRFHHSANSIKPFRSGCSRVRVRVMGGINNGNRRPKGASSSGDRRKQHPERRQSARFPLGIPIFVRGRSESGQEFVEFTTACNISFGGAVVSLKQHLPPASTVSLFIPTGPLPHMRGIPRFVQNLSATTVWKQMSEGYYLVGLKFSKSLDNLAKGKAGEKAASRV
jgi:hypothetical protein